MSELSELREMRARFEQSAEKVVDLLERLNETEQKLERLWETEQKLERAEAENDRLRKVLVWAMKEGFFDVTTSSGTTWLVRTTQKPMQYDGTDESLIETLCRLAQEGE